MKRYQLFSTLFITAAMAGCNGITNDHRSTDSLAKQQEKAIDSVATKNAPADENFAKQAAISSMFEIEAATKLLKTTENPDVQNLATIMLKDHLQASKELMTIAQQMKLDLPKLLPSEKAVLIQDFEDMEEFAKNKYYADLMVKSHQQAIQLFTDSGKVPSAQLSAFATKNLPILKHHLLEAQKVQQTLQLIKGDKGDLPLKRSNDNDRNYQKGKN